MRTRVTTAFVAGGEAKMLGGIMEGADKSHRACRGFLELAHVASVGVIDDAETERSIAPVPARLPASVLRFTAQ